MQNGINTSSDTQNQAGFSNVETIYVLSSGTLVRSRTEYEQVRDLFDWVDKKVVLSELLHLRGMTDAGKKSILAIYEKGKSIKTFLNLENDFHISDVQHHQPSV